MNERTQVWGGIGEGSQKGVFGLVWCLWCLMVAAVPVLAWGQAGIPPPGRSSGVTVLPRWRTTKLHRILVVGHRIRIPEPVVFEIIKAALKRTWSTSPRDGNQIVCQFHYPVGSHIQDRAVLFCQTNNEHFQFRERHFFMNYSPYGQGTILGPVGFQEFQTDQMHLVDPNRLRRLLAKLPAAGGRYEFKVMKHGHLESEWFMNRGKVVRVFYFKKEGIAR